jgi:hypothetical protein
MPTRRLLGLIALSFSAAAVAEEPPLQRAGLWEFHSHRTTVPAGSMMEGESSGKICRDDAYSQKEREAAKAAEKACTVNRWEKTAPGAYTVTKSCQMQGSVVDTQGTVREESPNEVRSEVHMTYKPAMAGVTTFIVVNEQKYLGSCPAGMKPGDQIAADGSVNHAP